MALIECPECGKKVSDKAKVCPECGCPIAEMNPKGKVKIKTCAKNLGVRIYNYDSEELLWSGTGGTVVTLEIDGPMRLGYTWGLQGGCNALDQVYTVEAGKKYQVVATGMLGIKFVLNEVDMVDSE